ncbi:MAG: AAA family ATPase [Fibrobacterales bacterium]|nr:AAA family ATPase [Fibrobacterales bacterium]
MAKKSGEQAENESAASAKDAQKLAALKEKFEEYRECLRENCYGTYPGKNEADRIKELKGMIENAFSFLKEVNAQKKNNLARLDRGAIWYLGEKNETDFSAPLATLKKVLETLNDTPDKAAEQEKDLLDALNQINDKADPGRKGHEREALKNKILSVFCKDTTFIPALDKFEELYSRIGSTYGLNLPDNEEGWLKKNKALINHLRDELPADPVTSNSQSGTAKTFVGSFDYDFVLRAFPTWLWAQQQQLEWPSDESPNVIFYGAPGTGKTFLVNEYLEQQFPDKTKREDRVVEVQFHPTFSYEDFIEGIKPTGINENGTVKLELVNGVFKDLCIKAKRALEEYKAEAKVKGENGQDTEELKYPECPEFYFVADEINRANLSAVFGETLSLLEAGYRDCAWKDDEEGTPTETPHVINIQYSELEKKTIPDSARSIKDQVCAPNGGEKDEEEKTTWYDTEGKFGIPRNIRFIGMMNDVDKSIDAFDLALRRRFKWVRRDCDYGVILRQLKNSNKTEYVLSCARLNQWISGASTEYQRAKQHLPNTKSLKLKGTDNPQQLGSSYEFGHSFFLKIKGKELAGDKKITRKHKENLFELHLRPTLKEYLRSSYDEKEVEGQKGLLETAKRVFADTPTEKNEPDNH